MGKSKQKKDENEKHFKKELAKTLRHFSRHDDECAYQEGSCNYPRFRPELPADSYLYQRHHILPIQPISKYKTLDAYSASERKTIDAVYAETKWCCSREKNLIVLAQKQLFWATGDAEEAIDPRTQDVESRLKKTNFRQVANLPCHNWDHWRAPYCYNDEVAIAFHQKIWQKIKKVADTKDCTTAEAVEKDIERLENSFREVLKRRGNRSGGTKKGLEASMSPKPPVHWWLPFSMANNDVAKSRPALPITGGPPKISWESESKKEEMRSAVKRLLSS
ncbi:MAG TPA: hypothetical protein VLS89_04745 [Candidatus Nanopelagicales bacterium]|nr:hypothetical protein [Candidatus Nanopelagicales bacterium]